MGNYKLWLAAEGGASCDQPWGPEGSAPGCFPEAPPGFRPDEGLRLIRAFSKINDHSLRVRLIELVEKFAHD
jgi:hypothetical protein